MSALRTSGSTLPGTRAVRVVVAEPSAELLDSLRKGLSERRGVAVVGASRDLAAAINLASVVRADAVVISLNFNANDAIKAITAMQALGRRVVATCEMATGGSRPVVDAMAAGVAAIVYTPRNTMQWDSFAGMVAAKLTAGRTDTNEPVAPAAIEAGAPGAGAGGSTARTRGAGAEIAPASAAASNLTIALGASTGGVAALTQVLTSFPADAPGTVVVQHMPPKFTGAFAQRLDAMCRVRVREGVEGDRVESGVVLIAPGGRHMAVKRTGGGLVVTLNDGPLEHHQRPAVDVLFRSVAQAAGPAAIGAVLTGMGADGATGLLAMRQAGARTIAQDQASCVVFGMPAEAIRIGAAQRVVPLNRVGPEILRLCSQAGSPAEQAKARC